MDHTPSPTSSFGKDHNHVPLHNEKSSTPAIVASEADALKIAREQRWQADQFIEKMEQELDHAGQSKRFAGIKFKNPKHFTWVMVIFASMGGMLFGLDQSLISGANLFLPNDLGFTVRQVSLVNSSMPLGAVAGAFLLSPSNEFFGRRGAIIVATILYTVGAALEAGAIDYAMMVTARIILGLGVGIETGTVPIYVAESVERRLRGNLVSLYQFNIALGEVLGFVVAAIFLNVKGNWRYILGSSVVFSTAMFIGMLFLPESPRFLMHKGRTVDAFRVWKQIRGVATYDSRAEFFVMKATVDEEIRNLQNHGAGVRFVWMDFFTEPRARRALVYANVMILLGQFVGINGIMYYMSVLMSQVGFDEAQSTYMSMVGGGALFLGTIPAILLMERCGRRFWAMTMLPGFFIGLVIVGISYLFDVNTHPGTTEGLYLTGLIIYMGFYGPYACLTWVIPSEVYPTYLRSYGMTTSDAMVFLGSFIITYNFSAMQEAFTKTGLTLGFFGGIAVLGWFYQILFMPETKDMTLEEIDVVFSKPTKQLVAENIASTRRTASNLVRFRFREAFPGFYNRRSE
ncbi:hypothetical protein LTR84_003038 [Exophiala bonariae]|uniref:Major facilitator superfamily (MFS) profile domain-containing protein n=1 Tax=Exophiala bonariae TaxID=1690606 RepID=A0AAV9N7Q9_9EURO|nr:hypothetical protein LTR84_003038 [Exophiala bonariae]